MTEKLTPETLAEILADAERYRKLKKHRAHFRMGCGCTFAEDEDTIREWCMAHAVLRDENARLRELVQRGINLPPSEYDYQWRMDARAELNLKVGD